MTLDSHSPVYSEGCYMWSSKQPSRVDRKGIHLLVSVSSPDSISRSGRSTGQGIGYPLQYSGLENSMDYTVHGVVKSWM